MRNSREQARDEWAVLDHHALVMAIWLAVGFVALLLMAHGCLARNPVVVALGFVAILVGFVGHVIINAVGGSEFTPREVALGLVVYGLGLGWFLLSLLLRSEAAVALFIPFSVGLLTLVAAVVFYMVTRFGVRRAFNAFDVIRDFGPGPSGTRGQPGHKRTTE